MKKDQQAALEAFVSEALSLYEVHYRAIPAGDFLDMTRKAVALKRQFPKLRERIAYHMSSLGAHHGEDPSLKPIVDLFDSLELPDAHIVTSDGLSVNQKWDRIEQLLLGLKGPAVR